MSAQNTLAAKLRSLHVPGKPILFTNVYDGASARAIAALPQTKALASASYAIAVAAGLADEDLTLDINLAGVRAIAIVAKEHGLPLTADFQDGYGEQLEEGIQKLLDLGVVGINLEDYDKTAKKMIPISEATERVRRVLAVAKNHGVPDFVVNARSDTLLHEGQVSDAIERGKAYLAAGATTAFVWGSPSRGGITKSEVVELVNGLEGRLNVILNTGAGGLPVSELAKIGVARISMGPALQFVAMKAYADAAEKLLLSQ
ncbi:uncharacterized protein BP5553_05601 [Venustampulla echinocandica]|uniref:Carboxyphosphonoenolpyruvate phosphonomutase-like protein n=1 Tax=Venustampulla echinocandica TaxID=2656787 RepID=A0A370TRP1_9HELO|nr:uncharacterized protein BP5553_05601 [Venustampulla echinocandica]RDL38168.1 hypothetical protein BP5553_05601 [Venustampulla echinocandica]